MRSPVRSIDSKGHFSNTFVFLHTCGLLHAKLAALDPQARSPGRLLLSSTCRLEASFEVTLVNAFVGGVQEMERKLLPADTSLWRSWAGAARLKQGGVQAEVLPTILKMLASMVCGQEAAHLRRLLRWADHKGSDVILRDGCLLQGSAQIAPYPAVAWAWRCVQHYKWGASQHINVLELTAFLNFLRSRAATGEVAGFRFFHIFDSQVAAAIAAKGRSSSRSLNRVSRRICAICCTSSCFVVSLRTISSWQPATPPRWLMDNNG